MNLIYSYHAKKRMKQRGITELEIEHVLNCPSYIKKSFENTKEAVGEIKNRIIKVKFIEIENYIKIITVI
ncbi:MAG: DUF4258 domain-containing protein [Nanoarchaeota archaeon]